MATSPVFQKSLADRSLFDANGKVILDTHPVSDQHQNWTCSRGSPPGPTHQIWWWSMNPFLSLCPPLYKIVAFKNVRIFSAIRITITSIRHHQIELCNWCCQFSLQLLSDEHMTPAIHRNLIRVNTAGNSNITSHVCPSVLRQSVRLSKIVVSKNVRNFSAIRIRILRSVLELNRQNAGSSSPLLRAKHCPC